MDIDVKAGIENFLRQTSDVHTFGKYVERVELYPVFLTVHVLLIAIALRSRDGSHTFAKHHPLSSLFVCVASCYGGTIIQNFLLARPIIAALMNTKVLVLGATAWYVVFFSPADLFWKFCQLKIVKGLLIVLKEVHRLRQIISGVDIAKSSYTDSWIIIVIIGAVRGSGAKFLMKPLDHFIRGEVISSNELLAPQFSTKSSVIISALLLNDAVNFIDIPITRQALLVCILAYMMCFQLSFLLTNIKDPYIYLEDIASYLILTLPAELLSEAKKTKTD